MIPFFSQGTIGDMTTDARRAALYLRQSREAPEGIARQRERTTALATARGWSIANEYPDDDVSASKARGEGTAWARMLADGEAGLFDVVIAVDLDRLLRNVADLAAITSTGAAVLTVDGELDLTTADGEFRATMLAGIARFEVRRKTERYLRAADQRAAQGVPHRTHRPFGWQPDGVTLEPTEAPVLAEMHERILSGDTVKGIARWLNESGVATPRGKEWTRHAVRKALLRERNAGLLIRRGVIQPTSQIAPVVPLDTWEAVRAILTDAERVTVAGRRSERYWLSGWIRCHCGAVMQSKTLHTRGTITPAYKCSAAIAGGAGPGHATIAAHIAEDAAREEIRFALLELGGAEVADSAEVIRLRTAQSDVAAERVGVQELYLLPGADKRHLAARIEELGRRHDDLARELDAAISARAGEAVLLEARHLLDIEANAARSGHPSQGGSFDEAHEARDSWDEAFDELSTSVKRRLARRLVSVTCLPARSRGRGVERLAISGPCWCKQLPQYVGSDGDLDLFRCPNGHESRQEKRTA